MIMINSQQWHGENTNQMKWDSCVIKITLVALESEINEDLDLKIEMSLY